MTIGATRFHLGDLATVQARSPFRGAIRPCASGDVWAVQMKDLHEDGVHWGGVVRAQLPARRNVNWLSAGDILFVGRGASFYAGCVADLPGPAVCSPHLFQVRVTPRASVLPGFLAWQLNQPPAQEQLRQAAAGSRQLAICRPALESVIVKVPTLADQQRILSVVHAARREAELLQALVANRKRQLLAIACDLASDPAPTPA